MAHQHAHARGSAGNTGALGRALALVLVMLGAELAGAWWSGSLALLSDAAHMFTDAAALAISLLADRMARRPADARRSFGYQRFEVLAAVLNAVLLLLAAAYVVWEAWRRLHAPTRIGSGVMLAVAVLGLAVNLLGMRILAGGQSDNMNLRGAYLEVWSDMLGSVGVIGGAIAIRLTGKDWIDSAVAVAIGLWVLPRTISLLRASLHVLLEGVPEGIDLEQVAARLRGCPGIADVHDLHIWSLGSGQVSLSVHAVVAHGHAPDDVLLRRTRTLLADGFGIHHSTVQLEQQPCEQAGGGHGF